MSRKIVFSTLTIFFTFFVLGTLAYLNGVSFKLDTLFQRPGVQWGWPPDEDGYFLQNRYGKAHPYSKKFITGSIDPEKKQVLILMGGSNTFGQGILNDNPVYFLERQLENTDVFSIAFPGWAINNLLPVIKSKNFSDEVAQRKGVIAYQFPYFHLKRICGARDVFGWSHGEAPRYVIKDSKLQRRGFIRDHFSYHYELVLIGFSKFLFQLGLRDHVLSVVKYGEDEVKSCLKLMTEILKEMERVLAKRYPLMSLRLIMLPDYTTNRDLILKYLSEQNIKFIDFKEFAGSALNSENRSEYFQTDGHYKIKLYEKMLPGYEALLKDI